jgi:3-isopropylmalate dehydrogenase
LLLRHSLGLTEEAELVEAALHRVIADGARTADIARGADRVLSTSAMTARILEQIG